MSPRWLNQVIDPAEMTEAEMRAELRHDLRVYEEVTFSLSKQAMGRRITVLVEELDRRLAPLAARSPSRTERGEG